MHVGMHTVRPSTDCGCIVLLPNDLGALNNCAGELRVASITPFKLGFH